MLSVFGRAESPVRVYNLLMKEALFYTKEDGGRVRCGLCGHRCHIEPGKRGICQVRENRDGALYSLVYGKVVAANTDPIEKKPLFHFLPGTSSFSIATAGCNFRCLHCQNYSISQLPREAKSAPIPGAPMTPEDIARHAENSGCRSISYTYTEPTIFMEYALDTARIARGEGLRNVFVTNGFMTPESASVASELIDAMNIDLKGDAEFYKKVCGARVEPVREAIKLLWDKGVWIEVTTLLIPGYNDSDAVLTEIAGFMASVSIDMPWHLSRFHPMYKLDDAPVTPVATIKKALNIGKDAGIKYVYSGNIPGEGGEDTVCPKCGTSLVERVGYAILRNIIKNSSCPECGEAIAGVWE